MRVLFDTRTSESCGLCVYGWGCMLWQVPPTAAHVGM